MEYTEERHIIPYLRSYKVFCASVMDTTYSRNVSGCIKYLHVQLRSDNRSYDFCLNNIQHNDNDVDFTILATATTSYNFDDDVREYFISLDEPINDGELSIIPSHECSICLRVFIN